MLFRRSIAVVVLAVAASIAFGQVDGGYGAAPAPTVVTVEEMRVDRGELICTQLRGETVAVKKTVTVDEGGMKKQVEMTVTQLVTRKMLVRHDLKDCEVYTAGGKKLSDEEKRSRLTTGTTLLVSLLTLPAPNYLKILRDDALILVTKTAAIPIYVGPGEKPTDRPLEPIKPK